MQLSVLQLAPLLLAALAPVVNANVFLCRDGQWKDCKIFTEAGWCVNFETGWEKKVSSIGPDPGYLCTFFVGPNCEGSRKRYVYPGKDYLGQWNDQFRSWLCEEINTETGFKGESLVNKVTAEME